MQNGVEPYLAAHAEEFYWERESGHPSHVLRYRAFRPRGVVVISHGFTENAEKYKEIVYYFIKEHFHVYLPEHCGHGKSYRLVEDPSLVYVDSYHRYVEDLLFVARKAKAEACGLPLVLYSHSMGGGIAAAAAAKAPHLFRKVVLSSPMIRPLTGKVPFADAKRIAAFACATERGTQYVVGQKPYQGIENFKQSSSLSRPRFLYYQQKREKEPLYHLNAASYGWLHAAAHLYRDLMRSGWKRIEAPVLLFQAENDHLVSNRAQERMIRKMAERRPGMAKMVKVPGAKHELFGTRGRMLQTYWNMVFAFLEKERRDDKMTQTEIEEYITQFPIYQYAFVKPEDIEFNDRVRQICKKECSRYGASWSCPPAVGTVEVCKERCMNYDHVLFFSSIAEVDNIMDMDETLKTKSEHEKITREIEQHLKDKTLLTFALSSDSCQLCDKCTYPRGGCRHLELMHPCIESHGIVVANLIEKNMMDYYLGEHMVIWFSMIFYKES